MSAAPDYSYRDNKSVLLPEESDHYEDILKDLKEGLSQQATKEELEIEELRQEDSWITVPSLYREGDLEGVYRYRIDDDIEMKAVYIFDHHDGKVVIGDISMIDYAGNLGIAPLMEEPLE